ncbi:Rieske 2Fe-2S domain-containing protein [Halobacteriaceae archaeon GCM10025711]
MSTEDPEFVRVASVADLADDGTRVVTEGGQTIALIHHEGEVHAVDNRCPHMGFPLTEGTVDDGVLTCHWHHARFELSCGDTFDPWADDVPTYPVEVRDDEVWVKPEPERDRPPAEHWRDRLSVGLNENLRLVIAKSVIGLSAARVPYTEPFLDGLAFGTEYRADGWGPGLTIHTALTNARRAFRPEDKPRAMYQGLVHVASDVAGEPPKFDQPSFRTRDLSKERLKEWFRETVEVRDSDGAERCLRTAIHTLPEPDVAEILFAAATDHRYLDAGHTLDFVNKAFESLDHVGWEHADQVLPSVVDGLTDAERSEESSRWRQPIDVAGLLSDTYDDLPDLVAAGADEEWTEPDDVRETLLGDDPHRVVGALTDAIRDGASPEELARVVTEAAAARVARFSTANEFNDWNTVHHTFTYCNAVHQATRRTDATELYRGVVDGAASVYLDRFLNVPPKPIPDGNPGADPSRTLEHLLDAFDEEGEVDTAGRLAADYLAADGDVDGLLETLGEGLLREDAGFHTIQNVEASVRQAELADDPDRRRVFLVAAARYLAAHTPTRREMDQTYRIASRLHRGEAIHEE